MRFKEIPLAEIVDVYVDNRGKTCPVVEKENSYKVLIATNCITESLYPEKNKVRYVDKETYENWFRSHPQPNDIIFVNKGTPGGTALVPENIDFCIAQDMVALRIKDDFDFKYVFAALRSDLVKKRIESMHVGTMIPHFKKGDFKLLTLPIPEEIKDQENIGKTHLNILKKIHVNNEIINKLEELAQTLFKRWFVDFEFPNEEGKPYKSSGGKMVESELGMIPEGWTVGTLADVGEIVGGGTPSKKVPDYYSVSGISWLTPKDLSTNKSIFQYKGVNDISELGLKKSSARLLPENTVLYSSRAPIGYTAIAGQKLATNQGFKSIIPFENYSSEYVYLLLKHLTAVIEANAGGSTFKEISAKGMKQIKTILPLHLIVKQYGRIVNSVFDGIKKAENENVTLKKLRDTLLPKLLLGKIDLKDVEIK